MPMRVALAILLLAVLGLAGFLVLPRRVETYRDKHVVAGQIRRPILELAVHVSKPQYAVINGKTYKGIRGSKPFYLEVPELNLLLFVTQDRNDEAALHILDESERKESVVSVGGAGFGSDFGFEQYGRKAGEPFTDFVEKIEDGKIFLVHRSDIWKETIVLNLATKSVERRETLYLDASGQVTNRSVQTNVTVPNR